MKHVFNHFFDNICTKNSRVLEFCIRNAALSGIHHRSPSSRFWSSSINLPTNNRSINRKSVRFSTITNKKCSYHDSYTDRDIDNSNDVDRVKYDVIASTKKWVDSIVVGEKLCPFVMPLKGTNTLRYVVSSATTTDEAVQEMVTQAQMFLPDHKIPEPPIKLIDGNTIANCSKMFDFFNDDSDSDDDDGDSSNEDVSTDIIDPSYHGDTVRNTDNNQIIDDDKHLVDDIGSFEFTPINSDQALQDVLSEAQSLSNQSEYGGAMLENDNSSDDDAFHDEINPMVHHPITPDSLKRHYQKVLMELEESVKDMDRPLPCRPYGAVLIMFDAPFVDDFDDFGDVCEAVYKKVLYELNFYDILNIWIFHPDHVHTVHTEKNRFYADDYVMRSPFPTFLLFREVDMKAAYLSGYPNIDILSDANKNKFSDQGSKTCRKRLESCYVRLTDTS